MKKATSSYHCDSSNSGASRRVWQAGAAALLVMVGLGTAAHAQCERVRLAAPDGSADDRLGNDIRISGDRMVVGAQLDDHSGFVDAGAAYVYVRSGNNWIFEARLVAAIPHDDDRFGWSVDIDGDLIIVGARNDDQLAQDAGAVYIFRRQQSRWVQEARLFAGDPEEFARFGWSVALDGDTALVGAPRENLQRGAAYVFRREGFSWSQEAKLGAQFGGAGGDELGYSVALDNDVAFLGAWQVEDIEQPPNHGSVFVHRRINDVWTFEQQLNASDRAEFENFGISLDLQGDRAVIGKWHDGANGLNAGAAYVFEYDGQTWEETQKLLAFDGAAEDLFGVDVGLDGSNIIVGARWDDDGGADAGSAYLFELSGNTWFFAGKLLASNGAGGDLFGNTVDLSGNFVVVGAPRHNQGAGLVYVYQMEGCNPTLVVDATCPGGGPITVSWSDATPNSQVALIYAAREGSFVIPTGRQCAGTRLGLGAEGIRLVQETTFGSGSNGSRTLFSNAAAQACGGYLQLLDLATCSPSNVALVD